MWIRPAGDVTGGKNSGDAGFEIFVDHDTTIHFQPGLLSECERWPHSHTQHDEIRVQGDAAGEDRLATFDASHGVLEMEDHTMSFVQTPDELTELRTEHALERHLIASDDVDRNTPLAQRGGDFQGDETGADDDHLFRRR